MKTIYLIKSEDSYKIGISIDPKHRRSNLSTGNPEEISIIKKFESKYPTKLETALHNTFNLKRKRGEWFILNENDISNFLEICYKYEKNFEILDQQNNYYFKKQIVK